MAKGQIRKALSGFYYVYSDGKTYQTRARGNFRNRNITPLVGDEVEFKFDTLKEGYILAVEPRKNELIRPPVANIDQAVLIISCKEPNFSENLLDRFLVYLEYNNIVPILYFTKTDLLDESGYYQVKEYADYFEKIGYHVLMPLLGHPDELVATISTLFSDKVTVFMGQTGAGKSTLINKISPELNLKTGEISQYLGRGKHTTRHVELIPLEGGLVGDTPGFSAIDIPQMETTELSQQFIEINEASQSCKFRECKHVHEPKCAVKAQVAAGEISQERYDNYLQILNELENRKPMYGKNKR
ncbi:ribosome small subunit-dependent GTPase A [Vagococcus xieshaowenii]|uniref:Small ribosomal subunit biogenesis GTPase RsgA n=1 Tax=Vagococcus xieshaowenii TaxID=2562451 RepID=A0AAJ5JLA5_9ENTE|nr:ribosome small subunit-dependent GTPase A [Vagococcus xieshaowenii]QCA28930.1 ribosome small subunit-dependent GTPase A [Vagococcus xieshaowenii]TFZ39257.1 ribosome small subunit-dependent GTPase A [Vagococcus xieshaowenii]